MLSSLPFKMIYPFRYNVANVSKSTVAFSLVFNFYELYILFTSPRHVRRWGGLVPTQEKIRLRILGNYEISGKCLNVIE